MTDERERDRRPAWRDDRVWQAGFLIGSAVAASAVVVGRRAERAARRGLVDWPTVERIAISRSARAPGALDPRRDRGGRPGLRGGDGADRAGAVRGARHASSPASSSVPASSTVPAGSGRTPRPSPRSSASSRPTCSTRSSRRTGTSSRRRWRWPTAGSPAASSASCSGSSASGSWANTTSRCCRPSRRRDGCSSSRRTSARPRRCLACRSTRSGPGSRCTRRPMPSSSRPTPGSGRTSRRGWSASSRCSAAMPADSDATRCAGCGARCAANRTGATGWSG